MRKFFLRLYLRWLEAHIEYGRYDDRLSRKIDRILDLLGK